MTKHTMVTFQLHRKGVFLIALGCVLLAVLLVAAGYFAGVARARPSRAPSKPIKKKAAKATPAVPQEAYSLRVALVTSEEEAGAEVKRLKVKKLAATIVPVETGASQVVYEIHVGRYADRRAAVAAAESLKREHHLDGAVVPAEP